MKTVCHSTAMNEHRVIIPEETARIVEFRQEGLPGIAFINSSLETFEPKVVFAWHLSIMLQLKDLILNGMPSQAERDVIDPFGDLIDAAIKGGQPEKPNALFFGTYHLERDKGTDLSCVRSRARQHVSCRHD